MWTWRLTVRWPVRQVFLFYMSVSWSNLRVWCCFSFSPSMHMCGPTRQSSPQMSIHFLHAEKSQPLMHHCCLMLVFVGKNSKVVASLWFRWQAPTSASILVLYIMWYGLKDLSEKDFVATRLWDLWSGLEHGYPKTVWLEWSLWVQPHCIP